MQKARLIEPGLFVVIPEGNLWLLLLLSLSVLRRHPERSKESPQLVDGVNWREAW
jgi:hypothetical protein